MPLVLKSKTVKLTKGAAEYSQEDLAASFQEQLPGDLMECVTLPEGENLNEWLAVNTSEFFHAVQMVYSVVAAGCVDTALTCTEMNCGHAWKYLWQDGKTYKRPTALSAPAYIKVLFVWVQNQLDDPTLFPVDVATQLPKDCPKVIKNIFRRLVRVYGHIFLCHYGAIVEAGFAATFNTALKHFVLFGRHFGLLDGPDLEPIRFVVE